MYVGGNFTTVQKGAAATGADKVAQPYLAAFNATTGDYIRSFRPVLNNQVKSLAALPDGRLAVGGEFTSVGGAARAGLVVVNPTTGALDTTLDDQRREPARRAARSRSVVSTSAEPTSTSPARFTHFVRGHRRRPTPRAAHASAVQRHAPTTTGTPSSTAPARRSTSATTEPGLLLGLLHDGQGASRPIARQRQHRGWCRRWSRTRGSRRSAPPGRLATSRRSSRSATRSGSAAHSTACSRTTPHRSRSSEHAHHQGRAATSRRSPAATGWCSAAATARTGTTTARRLRHDVARLDQHLAGRRPTRSSSSAHGMRPPATTYPSSHRR